jgi:hypothetical protein
MAECTPRRSIVRGILPIVLAACCVLPASRAHAQTVGAGTGVINGTITDGTGAVLPGVTIRISSQALIGDEGTRVTLTDRAGLYRFAPLPPGEYRLEFRLDGFTTEVREAVYISIGLTATIDVVLRVAGVQERVVVERGAPVLDRESTAIGTTFDARELAELPGARSLVSVIAATPAVHVGRIDVAGNIEHPGLYVAYGIGGQNRPMVEGMVVSGILGTGFTLNHGSFEEVAVGTAAHGPEWPMAGVQLQFIAKSGGNRYHGTIYADYLDRDWQAFNVEADQIRRGAAAGGARAPRDVNRLWSRFDVNADAGGFIWKDRLWWYGSVRKEAVSALAVNFPVRPRETRIENYTAKLTSRLTPHHKLIAFGQAGRNRQPNRLEPFVPLGGILNATTAIHLSDESTVDQLAEGRVWKIEWNAVVGETLFLDVRGGQFDTTRHEMPHGTSPRFEDIGTLLVRGGSRDSQQGLRHDQLLGSLSWFKDGWHGNHRMKVGAEVIRLTATETWSRAYPGDVLHVLQNDLPQEVYLFETPSRSVSGVWFYAAYAGDTWQINRRLTLNLGLRLDRARVFLPEQMHPPGRFNAMSQTFPAVENVIDWNELVPRVAIVHDLTRDGKTTVKGSYGRYWVPPGTDVGSSVNPNANQWWRNYTWSDPDGSGVWEPGEEGALRARRGGIGVESLDPRLELSFVNEAAGWIERELPGRIGMRTGVVWRGARQSRARQNRNWPFEAFIAPVAIRDPGPDGQSAAGDGRVVIQAFELGPDLLTVPPENVLRNVPGADSDFWTWDLIATRRFARRWSFTAGFSHTWNRNQASAYSGQPVRNNPVPVTPNDLINTDGDGAHAFTTWSLKAYGTYEMPGGVRVTPLLRHQSGQPFGRTFVASLNYGTVRVLAEPVGTRRMDHITILDLHIEKVFRVPKAGRVSAFVDLFNVLNANPEEGLSWSSGTSFLRPLSIVAPRVARVGAKLAW